MNATPPATRIEFDDTLALTYPPRREVEQAVLVPVPDGVETIIVPEWGGEQKFVGSWYAFYDANGQVRWGSAYQEFDESHEKTDDGENTYVKTTPIWAYVYRGEPAQVVTVLKDGTVETRNTVFDGDWMVKWPHGEVGVMLPADIRKRYVID